MFNIIRTNDQLPDTIKVFVASEDSLIARLSDCRREYFQEGWNIWKEGSWIYFLNIAPNNIGNPPKYLEKYFDSSQPFEEFSFQWSANLFNRNVLTFALFASLKFQITLKLGDAVKTPAELGFRARIREFLHPTPISHLQNQPIYQGLSFRPILLVENDRYFPAFIIDRIIRTKGIVGSPRELQNLSSIKSKQFFQELSKIIENYADSFKDLCIGDFQFSLNNDFAELNIIQASDIDIVQNAEEEEYPIEDEEAIFSDEQDSTEEELEIKFEEFAVPSEILTESLPIIPISINSHLLPEGSIIVGNNFSRQKMTTMYMLDKYGPFDIKADLTVIFIPIYLSSQKSIKSELRTFCHNLINGVQVNGFQFPGLKNKFNIIAQEMEPYEIAEEEIFDRFKIQIEEILRDVRKNYPQLENQYNHLSQVLPFFIYGQLPEQKDKIGEFTPLYKFVKQQLTQMGISNQTVVRFNALNRDKWRIYPLWSAATQIFSKVGGIPWVIDSHLDQNNNPIHAIVGLRFAKRYDIKTKKRYVLGVLSIITGNGQFIGFITDSYNYDEQIEKYNWISRQHGLTRFYDGLKLSKDDVNSLCKKIISFLSDSLALRDQPGSIVIHRLGIVSEEESQEFTRVFEESCFNMALISISNFPLRYLPPIGDIERGIFFQIDEKSGYLFTQGIITYNTSPNKKKTFTPGSCPSALKVSIIGDTGVYPNVVEAATDIFSLTRMNWRHTTYIPSNFPVSLQFALMVAQNFKNGIEPVGDYRGVPWFL